MNKTVVDGFVDHTIEVTSKVASARVLFMPIEIIHIRLLGEGTAVWRPVAAERFQDGSHRILGVTPDDEEWAFKPGEMVVTKRHIFQDGTEGIVADRLAFDPNLEFQNWEEVELNIDRAITGSPVIFDPATISNVRNFLNIIRSRCSIPEGASKGYWSTICISWKGIEVEIFDDHYELYQFHANGRTDIEYFNRVVGEDVPIDLLNRLPAR
jgi:hypothetical protein